MLPSRLLCANSYKRKRSLCDSFRHRNCCFVKCWLNNISPITNYDHSFTILGPARRLPLCYYCFEPSLAMMCATLWTSILCTILFCTIMRYPTYFPRTWSMCMFCRFVFVLQCIVPCLLWSTSSSATAFQDGRDRRMIHLNYCQWLIVWSWLTSDLQDIVADSRWRFIGHLIRLPYDTIRYDTIGEFNVDSKAEYSA